MGEEGVLRWWRDVIEWRWGDGEKKEEKKLHSWRFRWVGPLSELLEIGYGCAMGCYGH